MLVLVVFYSMGSYLFFLVFNFFFELNFLYLYILNLDICFCSFWMLVFDIVSVCVGMYVYSFLGSVSNVGLFLLLGNFYCVSMVLEMSK